MNTVHERLTFAREQAGLSIAQVERRLPLCPVKPMEDNVCSVAVRDLTNLAELYGVSPCWLILGGTTEEAEATVEILRRTNMRPSDIESIHRQLSSLRGTRRNV